MTELTQDNLQEIIAANPLVFVQFGAGWCGNCKIIKPKFKKYAAETPNATFVYVDAEAFPESRKLAKVDNLPRLRNRDYRNARKSHRMRTS